MSLQFLQYDVFTDHPFSGNQLAVFLDGRGLSAEAMQAIAKEMNFSESTFILPAETAGTDVRMRIFTPGTELPMAGHPTIGSTFALAHTGVIKRGVSRFTFGLGVGPTPVDLEWGPPSPAADDVDGYGETRSLAFAWMTQLNPKFEYVITDREGAAAVIGMADTDLAKDLPVQQVSCGVPYVLVPLRDRGTVDHAVTDLTAYRKFVARHHLPSDICIYLFAVDRAAPQEVYSRMFAPGFGIPEDPATGSAAGPLGCYLVRHRLMRDAAGGDGHPVTHRIVNLQGVKMGRPSRIHMAIAEREGQIAEVRVGGEAVLVAQGELLA